MSDSKQQLLELIEAFAAARTSQNQRLIQHSGSELMQFIGEVAITVTPRQGEPGAEALEEK
jgi:hypothetical protein